MVHPLVSVIIPVFNRPLFLKTRAIPSVLRQDYQNWEMIVVGDGQNLEAMRQVVEAFGDRRLRYTEIQRPSYLGLTRRQLWCTAGAMARNHGLRLARGEILAPLDDDDEFLPTHLSDSVRALADGQYDLVYGPTVLRDIETGNEQLEVFPWPAYEATFRERNVLYHSAVCYTRRYGHLQYPVEGNVAADYGLWLDIYRAGGRFVSVSPPQSVYYGDGLTSTVRRSLPSLPPLAEVDGALSPLWYSRRCEGRGMSCRSLERGLADHLHVPLCISYADKSLALEAALICLRHNEGLGRRQLIMPSYGPAELPRLAIKQGWEPVFCDIDEETLCLAPRSVESVLSRDVAAIAIVHAHGNPADMETIKAIATRHNLQLLSYLGKGLGARSGGNAIGSLGEICVLDFAAPAPIGVGEGAAVTVPAKALPCLMARYGPGEELVSGLSETLDVPASIKAIPAAFIEASLRHVADWIDQRQMLADRYATVLRCLPNVSLQRPESVHSRHAYADLAVICHTAEAANRLIDRLRAYRVECESGFPCLHRLPEYSTGQGRIPAVAERLADRVVLMPLYVGIRPAVTELVTSALCEAMQ